MNIQKISESFLLNKQNKKIVVSIIDSGFSNIPEYARIYGFNKTPNNYHGNRILSIFTSLDKKYPLNNLVLNLSCYDQKDEYLGLLNAIKILPNADILSISIAWKDDMEQIHQLLKQKNKIICAPYSSNTINPYPSAYNDIITCSKSKDDSAIYSIVPNNEWYGNSYSVPAIARLLCYGNKIENDENGIDIKELFSIENKPESENKDNIFKKQLHCPYCKRILRTKFHTLMIKMPEFCPYCSSKI